MRVKNIQQQLMQLARIILAIVVLAACSVVGAGPTITFTVTLPGAWSQNVKQYRNETSVICPNKKIELAWQIAGMNVTKIQIQRFAANWECATVTPAQRDAPCPDTKVTPYVLFGGVPPICSGGPKTNTISQGCIVIVPEGNATYALSVSDNHGGYAYNAYIDIVTENYVFPLEAHYDNKVSAWVASVQFVDPDILVKSVEKHVKGEGNAPPPQSGVNAWEITNDAVPNTTVRVMESNEVTVPSNFVLGGNYIFKPIDPQTGVMLSTANLDKNMVVSFDLNAYCK